MKIMSYNIRYDTDHDKENSFTNRKPFILSCIQEEAPDIIGFQEVLPHVALWFKENLRDYICIGFGRDADFGGEQVMIAYRKSTMNLHAFDTFWLSPTPDVPGSRYEQQSICPRTSACATFYSNELKGLFRVYNAHLDHEGSYARKAALSQILARMETDCNKQDLPAILLGDFNADPISPELRVLYDSRLLVDTTPADMGTFHDFGSQAPEKIDYIFTTKQFTCSNAYVLDSQTAPYLSDHYPVCADLILKA